MAQRADPGGDSVAVSGLRLLRARYELQCGPRTVPLTLQESALLTCLLASPGALVPIRVLQRALWPDRPAPPSNVLHVLVGRLRRKLAQLNNPGTITTVREQGYRFTPAPDAPDRPVSQPPRRHRLQSRAALAVHAAQYTMQVGRCTVPLTPLEARLLALLRQEAGRVVEHARLRGAGSDGLPVSANEVHVYMRRLRHYLQAAGSPWRLRTLWGVGYLLEPPPGG
jgi:DNA-binding response OmpR family regulator